jgi:hypothetical protein
MGVLQFQGGGSFELAAHMPECHFSLPTNPLFFSSIWHTMSGIPRKGPTVTDKW